MYAYYVYYAQKPKTATNYYKLSFDERSCGDFNIGKLA